MKILHAPTTVGGNPQGLARAEKELGHESISLTLAQNHFQYPTDITIWKDNDNILLKEFKRWKALYYSLNNGFGVIHYNFGSTIAPRRLRGNPKGATKFLKFIYNNFYGNLFSCLDLKIAKKKGIITAVTYQGSDARQGEFCKRNYKIHFCHEDDSIYTPSSDKIKQQQIEQINKYADLIYSVNPDLLQVLPKRAKFIPYASVDPRDWQPVPLPENPNDIIHIVHAPSNKTIKGTKYIIDAFERLKSDGIKFKYTLVENVPNHKAKKIYETADILIDQLLIGFYGGLAVELMALAKPVICYIREEDLKFMPQDMVKDMPIINANPENIYEVLKQYLTTDKDKLRRIGLKSRKYVEKYHDPIKIARQLIEDYKNINC